MVRILNMSGNQDKSNYNPKVVKAAGRVQSMLNVGFDKTDAVASLPKDQRIALRKAKLWI